MTGARANAFARKIGRRLRELAADAAMELRLLQARFRGDERQIRATYKAVFGCEPRLDAPVTFNEKLQYLKLRDHSPLRTRCADKLAVRDYVRERMGEQALIPLLLVTENPDDVRPERIAAERFAAKCTHDSGSTQICTERSSFDWSHCRRRLRRAMSRDFSRLFGEIQYRDVPRRIIVEEFLEFDERTIYDYKFHCFDGEPRIVAVNLNRHINHRREHYDQDWNRIPVAHKVPNADSPVPRPASLGAMLDHARALSAPFKLCRVDLYDHGGRIWFSEITFHDKAGLSPFVPAHYDEAFGRIIAV